MGGWWQWKVVAIGEWVRWGVGALGVEAMKGWGDGAVVAMEGGAMGGGGGRRRVPWRGGMAAMGVAAMGGPVAGAWARGVGRGAVSQRPVVAPSLRQVGEIKAHAAEWKANVTAEFRETRRRLSVEIHDKLQRAATIRSMERRRLGLDQRAHSLDMLSPEKRSVFAALDAGRCKASSQESIDHRPNNLRLQASEPLQKRGQGASEDNIVNKLGSASRLTKRKNRDLRKALPEDVHRLYRTLRHYSLDEEKKEEGTDKGCSSGHSSTAVLTDCAQPPAGAGDSVGPADAKDAERDSSALLEARN